MYELRVGDKEGGARAPRDVALSPTKYTLASLSCLPFVGDDTFWILAAVVVGALLRWYTDTILAAARMYQHHGRRQSVRFLEVKINPRFYESIRQR